MNAEQKREHERKVIRQMIRIYCRGKHRQKSGLCDDCSQLLEYADFRTQKCPFMEIKTFCSACRVHCYSPQMRERIKNVMGYAGPRMLLYNPPMAVRHMMVTLSGRRKAKTEH